MMTKINEQGVPAELKAFRQWVLWRYEQLDADKKPTKVPYSAITGKRASTLDRFSWSTFDDAVAMLNHNSAMNYDGVGFVLTKEDPYTVVDLDAPATAEDAQLLNDIYFKLASFSERSPSGVGIHVWTKAEVAKGRNKRPVEVYSTLRFITVTGNVTWDRPIEYRQDEVYDVWQSIAPKVNDVFTQYDGNDPPAGEDQDIVNRAASARNGYKFTQLWNGHFTEWYASQSEADFALIDMLAFYTQNTEQIARLFRFSELGKREKAQRDKYVLDTIAKAYDKLPPKIDFAAMQQQTAAWIQEQANFMVEHNMPNAPATATIPTREHAATVDDENFGYAAVDVDAPYTVPGGLLGEIADFIYKSSPRQIKEVAIATAIGLMAGITGNAYNVSGTGLNVYMLLLANTGAGKDALHNGAGKLLSFIKPVVPAAELFIGPAEIQSSQALLNYMNDDRRCFVSSLGECGMWLKDISNPNAPAHLAGIRRLLLQLYGRSGHGASMQPSIYADKTKNTKPIISPSLTLLGETTPERFFDHIDEELIAEGFVPRWIIMQYDGKRPPHNESFNQVYPTQELIEGLANLCNFCHQQMHALQALNVAYSAEAEKLIHEFDRFCDEQINNTSEEAIRNLWTRAHLKALKLAALVAVGKNIGMPTIQVSDFVWARHIVMKDITRMCRRFNSGMLAAKVTQKDAEQQEKIIQAIKTYFRDPKVDTTYKIKPEMRAAGVIPYYYFSRKYSSSKVFTADRRGAPAAMLAAIQNLINAGILTQVPEAQCKSQFGAGGKIYAVADFDMLN